MEIIDYATELHRRFVSPLWPCLEASPRQRECQDYTHRDFLEVVLSRVVMFSRSGRDLLQCLTLMRENVPQRSNYFEARKSGRRLAMVEDVATRLWQNCSGSIPDALAQFPELDGFDIYAGDGHSHEHATHDERIDGTKLCVTHLYTRNLHNGWMTHLSLCPVKDKGNHHDMSVLNTLEPAVPRQVARKRRKVHPLGSYLALFEDPLETSGKSIVQILCDYMTSNIGHLGFSSGSA